MLDFWLGRFRRQEPTVVQAPQVSLFDELCKVATEMEPGTTHTIEYDPSRFISVGHAPNIESRLGEGGKAEIDTVNHIVTLTKPEAIQPGA